MALWGGAGLTALLIAGAPARDLDPQLVAKWPGFSRDGATAVAVAGDYAYVAAGTLQVFDVRNPANPQRVGGFPNLDYIRDVAVSGKYAYLASESAGLYVMDLNDPAATPMPVNENEWPGGGPETVVLSDELAIVTGSGFGLQVFDLHEPAHPQRIGRYTIRSPSRAVIQGELVYVVELESHRLHLIDISNPARPQQVGNYVAGSYAQTLAAAGDFVFLAVDGGLQVINVSDPVYPRKVGYYAVGAWITGLLVSGVDLYVSRGSGLEVLDISDPVRPKHVVGSGAIAVGGFSGMALSGEHLYLAGWDGLQVVAASTPAQLRHLGGFSTAGDVLAVAVSGQYAYVADDVAGLQVINITNPATPLRVGGLTGVGAAKAVVISGNYAYLLQGLPDDETALLRRLEIVAITDPADPRRISGIGLDFPVTAIAVAGNYTYVAGSGWDDQARRNRRRLEVIDLSDPLNPRKAGTYETTLSPGAPDYERTAGLAVSGPYAYMTSSGYGENSAAAGRLEVIDVRDPASPRKVGSYEAKGQAMGVVVAGDYAYIAGYGGEDPPHDWLHSLNIVDIRDPANPRRVGTSKRGRYAENLAVSGNFAYVTDGLYGIEVFDVSNPAAPVLAGGCETGGNARGVAIAGSYALVASAHYSAGTWYSAPGEGLVVLDVSKPANPQRVARVDSVSSDHNVAISGSYAYSAKDGLQITDIRDPANAQVVGSYTTANAVVDLELSSPHAYVLESWWAGGQDQSRLTLIDVSDPAKPSRLGGYEMSGKAVQVAVSGDVAYLAEVWYITNSELSRLSLFDVRDPSRLNLLGSYTTNLPFAEVTVSGQYAYVARSFEGLEILDCRDVAKPKTVGSYLSSLPVTAVAVSGRLACVGNAGWGAGAGWLGALKLKVLDVSDPANPRRLGEVGLSGAVSDITMWGQYAYVAAGWGGVHVVDLSDPAHPRRVGGNRTFDAHAVAVHDGRAVVAASDAISILDQIATLRFGLAQIAPDGTLRLSLSGVGGERVQVQRSANLLDWEDWRFVVLERTTTELGAEVMNSGRQFYRAFVLPPRP